MHKHIRYRKTNKYQRTLNNKNQRPDQRINGVFFLKRTKIHYSSSSTFGRSIRRLYKPEWFSLIWAPFYTIQK